MSSNFEIQISQEFLSRFPEKDRAVAKTRAQYVLYGMLYGYAPRTFDGILNASETEFVPGPGLSKGQVNTPLAPYFDEHAVIVIENKEDHSIARLPALNVLCQAKSLYNGYYSELQPMVANYANVTEGGTYGTPFSHACRKQNCEMLTLLSFNSNFDPNDNNDETALDTILEVGSDSLHVGKPAWDMPDNYSAIEILAGTENLSSAFYDRYPVDDTMIRYIERGAHVSELAYSSLAMSGHERVLRYIDTVKERLAEVDVQHCSAYDVRMAYAVGQLSSFIGNIAQEPGGRATILALRDELPDYVNEALAPVYQIIEQNSWSAFVEQPQGASKERNS